MKWSILAVLLMAFLLVPASAEARGNRNPCDTSLKYILNECVEHPTPKVDDDNKEPFDYGAYLHFILWEGKNGNWELGNLNTYEHLSGEFKSFVGLKLYLNRLYQKK